MLRDSNDGMSSTNDPALTGCDIVHEINVRHERRRRITYETCISICYIPLLLLGSVECQKASCLH
jgi:hypothetical protein